MTDRFSLLPIKDLLKIILDQYYKSKSILGISEELFFKPEQNKELRSFRFGKLLESPLGVAAGPHTQLAQNIIVAWLTGARFIELKTIQTLDELNVSKPCIDMQDEGYNCEWSQELKIEESFNQYLDAWIIIHVLRDLFGWHNSQGPGVLFNMSVGYDLKGIMNDNVQWFFSKMSNASAELNEKVKSLEEVYPSITKLHIEPCLSDNITLSTMHGCPAHEIETIGAYLLKEKKLHTAIKLNPTLIGKENLQEIIRNSGFETRVPDLAFEHDPEYDDALVIIRNLQEIADKNNLQFSVKLTNTLESQNHKEVFDPKQEMMYMSGRALHPVSINLAARLQNEFHGKLDISFSGGVNASNVAHVLQSGLSPITICSDLLKPGGYGRLNQYIENLKKLKETPEINELAYLNDYANKVLKDRAYKKTSISDPSIKTSRPLAYFDCIYAPCVDTCPTNQGIPDYIYYTSQKEFHKAAEVILQTNPFPHTTGMVCDHLCQTKCTRIHYDQPVLIREIKRFIAENYIKHSVNKKKTNGLKMKPSVSIIGAGPSGLSCAFFLARAGFKVDVYESRSRGGGMVQGAIPSFRLTNEALETDMDAIIKLGVNIHYNFEVNKETFQNLRNDSDFIYLATGARKSKKLKIPGLETKGVLDPLDFLFRVKEGKVPDIGKDVIIIGGGNTAMDAARTTFRLVGDKGRVRIVYRRTIKQMPADMGEIKAVLDEGVEIIELLSPIKVESEKGRLKFLRCKKMRLGERDKSGRATPSEIPGSTLTLSCDTLIPAIGQDIDIDFADASDLLPQKGSYETQMTGIFIGGDALRGASTAINAIGDGRKAAEEILERAKVNSVNSVNIERKEQDARHLMLERSKRKISQEVKETDIQDRRNFNFVTQTLSEEEAVSEASRCLLCDELCNTCTKVCPNMAFHSYKTKAVKYQLQKVLIESGKVTTEDSGTFEVKQKHQILHLAEWCNMCGNCETFCPSSGAPYKNKPHLYLNKQDFLTEKDGFYFQQNDKSYSLLGFYHEKLYELAFSENSLLFKGEAFSITLNKENLRIEKYNCKPDTHAEFSLQFAAEMKIIAEGAMDFLSISTINNL